MPTWGADLTDIDFDDIYYYIRPAESQGKTWDDVPAYIKETFEKLGIPEAERKFLAGVGAQYESEVVYHSLREDLEKLGVIFLDMDSAVARAPGDRQEVLRHDHPAERQQVRGAELGRLVGWLVRLHSRRRQGRRAAPGLLPDQRREHGPVRAHADHLREGLLRPLRRGLHRADLFDQLAALGGGRDHRQGGRSLPLHDDPELVEERLQPRHQARRGLQERDDGVGRWQPRLQGRR